MVGSQDKPKLEAGEELRFNENIGYADFDLAVEAVAKEASMLGVTREKKDVTRLIADGGVCRGVEAGDCSIVVKKETVVAAGPWTPRRELNATPSVTRIGIDFNSSNSFS